MAEISAVDQSWDGVERRKSREADHLLSRYIERQLDRLEAWLTDARLSLVVGVMILLLSPAIWDHVSSYMRTMP